MRIYERMAKLNLIADQIIAGGKLCVVNINLFKNKSNKNWIVEKYSL